MRTIKLLTTLACLLAAMTMSAQSPIAVDWHMGQNNTSANNYNSRFVIKNISKQPLGDNWQFFFNQFSRQVTVPAGCPVDIEEVSTTYYRVKPNGNYKPIAAGDSLVVEMVMGGAVIILFFLPWLDRSPARSIRYRPGWHKVLYGIFVVWFLILMVLGVMLPGPLFEAKSLAWLTNELVAMVGTLFYFGFFLLMPWWSQLGTPKPVPDRVVYHAH